MITFITIIWLSFVHAFGVTSTPDEGMYPLSMIKQLNLKSAGMQLNYDELINPDQPAILDALVRVGGCTGSFVSSDGLVITNHHCVFGALSRASTPENDILNNGFAAATQAEEIAANGMQIRITTGYKDVTTEVLMGITPEMTPEDRIKAIQAAIKSIETRENEANPELENRVSEMFAGKNYVLFHYQVIKDVRLVYSPPRTIGEFGGESDNWVWPRHTGDFSFVRAYVGKDGKPAEYSEDNIPFKPKRHLQINPNGVNKEDFVFILGYPGRTFRHQPAAYVEQDELYRLPFIADIYQNAIDILLERAGNDLALNLKFSNRIKGMANVTKNYQGKLKGLQRLSLVDQKQAEEKELEAFIQAGKATVSNKNVIKELNTVYEEMNPHILADLWIGRAGRTSLVMAQAWSLVEWLKSEETDSSKISAEKTRLKNRLGQINQSIDLEADTEILMVMINKGMMFPSGKEVEALKSLRETGLYNPEHPQMLESLFLSSPLMDNQKIEQWLNSETKPASDLFKHDPLFHFTSMLMDQEKELSTKGRNWNGRLNSLMADYVSAKEEWKGTQFIPDANGTLRLTYGYVRGYSPEDAVFYEPISTLQGVFEKAQPEGDYAIPSQLTDVVAKLKSTSGFDPKKQPVGFLYNTDTSGGNSGSPIMDAKGRLVGVNFDRAYHATINDYAWSESYSRSIGVDIRYVLWVTQHFGGAEYLLTELGVK